MGKSLIGVDSQNRVWCATGDVPFVVDDAMESVESIEADNSSISFDTLSRNGIVKGQGFAYTFSLNEPSDTSYVPIETSAVPMIEWSNSVPGAYVMVDKSRLVLRSTEGKEITSISAQNVREISPAPSSDETIKYSVLVLSGLRNLRLVFLPPSDHINKDQLIPTSHRVVHYLTSNIKSIVWTHDGVFAATDDGISVMRFEGFPNQKDAPHPVHLTVVNTIAIDGFTGFIKSDNLYATTTTGLFQISPCGLTQVSDKKPIGYVNRVMLMEDGSIVRLSDTEADRKQVNDLSLEEANKRLEAVKNHDLLKRIVALDEKGQELKKRELKLIQETRLITQRLESLFVFSGH